MKMELSSQEEAEIPMPMNSAYGGVHGHGHGHGHHHHHGHNMTHHNQHHYHNQQDPPPSSSNGTPMPSNNNISNGTNSALNLEVQQQRDCNPYSDPTETPSAKSKKAVRYRECQKNHAAAMGGNATDGCGEFMPSGSEGTLEALTCSACNCHRNFHRREVEGELYQSPSTPRFYLPAPRHHPHHLISARGRKMIFGTTGATSSAACGGGGQGFLGYPTTPAGALMPVSRAVPINVSYQVGPGGVPSDQSEEHDEDHHYDNGGGVVAVRPPHQLVRKRFRTKFSQEQKEKMLEFAEKVGWKIQKQEESVVQQFCQEVGVKRRVLKVWMHNNKHTLAKKNNNNPNTIDNNNNNDNNNNIDSSNYTLN